MLAQKATTGDSYMGRVRRIEGFMWQSLLGAQFTGSVAMIENEKAGPLSD